VSTSGAWLSLIRLSRRPSAYAYVEEESFRIPILFLTQSRAHAHFLNGSIPPDKCTRKPKTIFVSLIANDQEYDRVSLDMAKDFKKLEPSVYALRSEILLHGPEGTTPIQ